MLYYCTARLQAAAGFISVSSLRTHVNAAVWLHNISLLMKLSSGPLWDYTSGKTRLEVLHCSRWAAPVLLKDKIAIEQHA